MAHQPLCGTGTWVQAQQSFLFFEMASAVQQITIPQHPPFHSICNAESRDRSFHRTVPHSVFGLRAMQSKTFPPFTGYELACLADLALIHTQQVQNLQISMTPKWNCIPLPMP